MKIGITGSSGFLGTCLRNKLASGNKIIEFVGDTANSTNVKKFMGNDLDILYHLASKIPKYDEKGSLIDQSFESNILGTQNIVDFATNQNLKIIFSSTQKVYGEQKNIISENSFTEPIGEYEKSKLKSEQILQSSMTPNKITILRFSNIYGGYPKPISIIESIAESLIFQKNIQIGLHGKIRRDYIHISDVIDAFILAKDGHGIFNIGYGKSFSTIDLIKLFEEMFKKSPDIKFAKSSNFDILLDCTKAEKILKFKPKISIADGIKLAMKSVNNFTKKGF